MKPLLHAVGAFWLSLLVMVAAENKTPLNRAFLQSNMNGNGYQITNLDSVVASNFIDAATGAPLEIIAGSATNVFFGSSSNVTHSLVSGSNVFTVTGTVPSATSANSAIYVPDQQGDFLEDFTLQPNQIPWVTHTNYGLSTYSDVQTNNVWLTNSGYGGELQFKSNSIFYFTHTNDFPIQQVEATVRTYASPTNVGNYYADCPVFLIGSNYVGLDGVNAGPNLDGYNIHVIFFNYTVSMTLWTNGGFAWTASAGGDDGQLVGDPVYGTPTWNTGTSVCGVRRIANNAWQVYRDGWSHTWYCDGFTNTLGVNKATIQKWSNTDPNGNVGVQLAYKKFRISSRMQPGYGLTNNAASTADTGNFVFHRQIASVANRSDFVEDFTFRATEIPWATHTNWGYSAYADWQTNKLVLTNSGYGGELRVTSNSAVAYLTHTNDLPIRVMEVDIRAFPTAQYGAVGGYYGNQAGLFIGNSTVGRDGVNTGPQFTNYVLGVTFDSYAMGWALYTNGWPTTVWTNSANGNGGWLLENPVGGVPMFTNGVSTCGLRWISDNTIQIYRGQYVTNWTCDGLTNLARSRYGSVYLGTWLMPARTSVWGWRGNAYASDRPSKNLLAWFQPTRWIRIY